MNSPLLLIKKSFLHGKIRSFLSLQKKRVNKSVKEYQCCTSKACRQGTAATAKFEFTQNTFLL
jgi:hypothetical protein